MPKAGWCRECGEWIWVDEDGACQHGHGPECVDGVYDAKPQDPKPPSEAFFGAGEMPDDVYRFSWAAFTLPFFWGVAYGVWPIVLWWVGSLLLPIFLSALMISDMKTAPVALLVGITVASEAVNGIVRLWAAVNAQPLLWRKEAFRLEVLPDAKPRISVARFRSRQRIWAIAGWTLLILALVASVVVNYLQWKEYGLAIAGAVEPLVFVGAEVWLGVWLSIKMQQERPGLPGAAEGPAEYSA